MLNEKLYAGAHAPFWHNGDTIRARSYNIMVAALPAVFMGIYIYGVPALRVMALAVAGAMFWEWLLNQAMRRPSTIGDGNAAVIGLLLGMLLPATMPWYAVIVTSFVAVVIGKLIYGGVGCNPLNPTLVGLAILMLSWQSLVDFDAALGHYDMDFYMLYPLGAVKAFGAGVVDRYSMSDLLWGRQAGGIGSTFGLGLLVGGCYLMARGFIRWEISLSFLVGLFLTALLFHLADPGKYAGPVFHVLTGYSLIGAFFLATEDSSSPVNFIPMILYGLGGGVLTVLIRNIGAFPDGVVFAILMMNVANPLLDKIRPKAMGRRE
jgi:Na+-translocating ferredoxin:NAD+ oxidoreductase subunit D